MTPIEAEIASKYDTNIFDPKYISIQTETGYDPGLTAQLRATLSQIQTYLGIMRPEFDRIAWEVATGKMTCEAAMVTIDNMKWQEEASNISKFYMGICEASTFSTICKRMIVPSNTTAANISIQYKLYPGAWCDVIAFSNGDGTHTITSIGTNFGMNKAKLNPASLDQEYLRNHPEWYKNNKDQFPDDFIRDNPQLFQ
jgi:hypothetical protein